MMSSMIIKKLEKSLRSSDVPNGMANLSFVIYIQGAKSLQVLQVLMKYNTLGHTGLLVSELCLGTMTFAAGEGMWKPIAGVEQDLADEILRLSVEAGINFVDTADVYTHGESEKSLAQAMAN